CGQNKGFSLSIPFKSDIHPISPYEGIGNGKAHRSSALRATPRNTFAPVSHLNPCFRFDFLLWLSVLNDFNCILSNWMVFVFWDGRFSTNPNWK
ncbi:hypothetical protein LINGRAHAP2_LOCUS9509, partial [Linum grandiflorum]